MEDTPISFDVIVNQDDANNENIDRLTRNLYKELRELDIENVNLKTEKSPDGTKSDELVTIGAILLTTLPVTLPAIIQWLQAWSIRDKRNSIKIRKQVGKKTIEIEISDSTSPEILKEYIKLLENSI